MRLRSAFAALALGFAAAACRQESADRTPAPAPLPNAAPAPAPPPSAHPPPPASAADLDVPAIEISASPAAIAKGKDLFSDKGCVTCHLTVGGVKALGPELAGIFDRRPQPYVERMILHPEVMIRSDPTAKQLFAQYSVPMTNQRVDAANELPFLLAYLKSLSRK